MVTRGGESDCKAINIYILGWMHMKIKIDLEIPDGKYCNEPNKTGCQFLTGVGRIGRCFCVLYKKHLDNDSEYGICGANIKCEDCFRL